MRIELNEIEYYVKHHEAKQNTWYRPYCQEAVISPTRQEIVLRLSQEINYYQNFPLWNHDLIEQLFPKYHQLTDNLIIMPVVGSEKYFDAKILKHKENDYLVIDLLNIADYTTSVNQMCYILHNLCHVNILRYILSHAYEMPKSYYEQMEYRFFCEGLVQYLSWNHDVREYRLREARYLPRKKEAIRTLNAALQVEGVQIQNQILGLLNRLDLWQRFPDAAGLFYCDYNFQTGGFKQLKQYVAAGVTGSIQAMQETDLGKI